MNQIPGRAHTPEQKRAIIQRLYTIWLDAPTLRLGQLIYIATGDKKLFDIEDEILVGKLRRYIVVSPVQEALKEQQRFPSLEEAIHSLKQSAGVSNEDLEAISKGILRLADFGEEVQ